MVSGSGSGQGAKRFTARVWRVWEQGLEGVGQEAVLEIPLGGGHEAVNHFRFQVHVHFDHQADDAG